MSVLEAVVQLKGRVMGLLLAGPRFDSVGRSLRTRGLADCSVLINRLVHCEYGVIIIDI